MLHEQELEPGLPINVYISNPERKKDRTDANANAKEVYVAGLSKFTSKADLERLFSTVFTSLPDPFRGTDIIRSTDQSKTFA